jgi:hypothetical protein
MQMQVYGAIDMRNPLFKQVHIVQPFMAERHLGVYACVCECVCACVKSSVVACVNVDRGFQNHVCMHVHAWAAWLQLPAHLHCACDCVGKYECKPIGRLHEVSQMLNLEVPQLRARPQGIGTWAAPF